MRVRPSREAVSMCSGGSAASNSEGAATASDPDLKAAEVPASAGEQGRMISGGNVSSIDEPVFSPDRFVPLRRQKRQIEPLSHFFRFPAEPLVGAPMLASVIPEARRPKFGDARNVDEYIDREIAILLPGEFIGDVAGDPKLVGPAVAVLHAKQFPQIVEQAEFCRVTEDVRSGIEPGKIRFHSARRGTVGKLIGVGSRFRHHLDYSQAC